MPTRRLLLLVLAGLLSLGGARLTLAAPERCRAVTAAEARAAAAAAASWLRANQHQNGTYRYVVDAQGRDRGGYSIVRHAGVTLSLYQAANAAGDEQLRGAADRGLAWMMDHLVERDGWLALDDAGTAPLGGSALMLAALAERRTSDADQTYDDTYDQTMRALGRFLVAMQAGDGRFYVSIHTGTGTVDRAGLSPYFDGEALWALARLQRALPDPAVRAAAERAARYAAVERDDREFVPVAPLNDHWGSYAFAEMADWPLGDAEAEYARAVSGRFHLLIRFEAHKESGSAYSWAQGPPRRAAALGTWVEGQAALTRLSRTDSRLDDLRDDAVESTRCGAGVLVARQRVADDPRVDGAWFTGGETRMDDQQHAISGLLALADLLDDQTERSS